MTKQPTLTEAWATQGERLRGAPIHTTNGTLNACRFNALVLTDLVEQAFRDAGYFPMMLLLGTVVRPVIENGQGCSQCPEPRAFEWYRVEDDIFVVDVSRDLAGEHDTDWAREHGCTPAGDCQLFRGLSLGLHDSETTVTTFSAGYLRRYATAINPERVTKSRLALFNDKAFIEAEAND